MAAKERKHPELPERDRGRPSLFEAEYCDQVRKLCKLGATDQEIADFFDVGIRTIYNWKNEHPEFVQAIKDGKLSADMTIVDSLHKRGSGYEYDEAVPIKLKDVEYKDGKKVRESERVEIVMVRRIMPPETTAMIFWLKNRRRADWRDKADLDVNVHVTMTPEERRARIDELLERKATAEADVLH